MGFKTSYGKTPAIYAKLNVSKGKILVPCEKDTPGAVEYIVSMGEKKGEKRYRLEETGIVGRLVAVKSREDTYMGVTSTDITLAFADANPSEPTILLTARLIGGEKGAVSMSVLSALEALVKADKTKVLDLNLAHNPPGSQFIDKDGNKHTREFPQTTIFIRHYGDDPKDFIRDSREARPKVEDIKDKSGKVVGKDYSDMKAYAMGVFNTLHNQVEESRAKLNALMDEAATILPEHDDNDLQFGG